MSIQDYELLSKIGSGSFGVVHKARDRKTNAVCVIKMVDISNMNMKMRKSAMEEGKLLKEINSPYVVKHYNTFIAKSTLHIVMQYCPKGDLAGYMKSQMGKPIKEETIWKFALQMMVGLRDLHAKKILHRDIKTLNVFLDDNYDVRIGDLGVAKTMTADFAHTIVGTPYYLSPEMCEQKPYNEKTDIWAMGCVIYELCAGKRPFEANNQAALAFKIVIGKYEPIPQHYSQDLNWIVKSCLSVDYKRRPTAAYILSMQKSKQWAAKLNLKTGSEGKTNEGEKKLEAKKDSVNISSSKKEEAPKNSHSKQKAKVTKEAEKNVKEVIVNKLPNDSKQKKISGRARLEMINKGIAEKSQPKSKSIDKNKASQQLPKPKSEVRATDTNKYNSQKPSIQKTQPSQRPAAKMINTAKASSQKGNKKQEETEFKIEMTDSSDEQKPSQQREFKKLQVIHYAQQVIDDDELLKQFGVPARKPDIRSPPVLKFELEKSPTNIDWRQLKAEDETQVISKVRSSRLGELPMIKTASTNEIQKLEEMDITQEETEDQIEEDIEENRPYISDEQSSEGDGQDLLIEDFDQKEQDLNKKMKENQKRKAELEKMKKHFEPQLLKFMNKAEYEHLKTRLTSCNESEVDEIVSNWKGNIRCINLFYRLIHFETEVKRCQANMQTIESRLQEIKKQKC